MWYVQTILNLFLYISALWYTVRMVSAKTNMEIDWQMHREGNIQFTFAYCRLFTVCWINLNSPQWFSYGAQTFTEGQVRQRDMRAFTGWETEMKRRWTKALTDSCRSFLRWNRLILLSSPLLTWPRFLKKTMRAGEENTEEGGWGEKGRDTLTLYLSSHHFGGWQTQI